MKHCNLRGLVSVGASLSAAALSCGCNGDAPGVNPAPPLASEDMTDAGGGAVPDAQPDSPAGDSGPAVRSVMRRDPWGQLDPANMLHDGDFEHSGMDTVQYPWLGIEQSYIRTGATCRSGLRCIEMPKGHYVMGIFVWPDAPKAEVSFYGKPLASNDCEADGVGLVFALDQQDGPQAVVGPEAAEPVDGWCRYALTMSVPQDPGYRWWVLVVATRSASDGPTVFDEASIVGVTDAGETRALRPLRASDRVLVERAREKAKTLLPPNPPERPAPVKNPTGRRSGAAGR